MFWITRGTLLYITTWVFWYFTQDITHKYADVTIVWIRKIKVLSISNDVTLVDECNGKKKTKLLCWEVTKMEDQIVLMGHRYTCNSIMTTLLTRLNIRAFLVTHIEHISYWLIGFNTCTAIMTTPVNIETNQCWYVTISLLNMQNLSVLYIVFDKVRKSIHVFRQIGAKLERACQMYDMVHI